MHHNQSLPQHNQPHEHKLLQIPHQQQQHIYKNLKRPLAQQPAALLPNKKQKIEPQPPQPACTTCQESTSQVASLRQQLHSTRSAYSDLAKSEEALNEKRKKLTKQLHEADTSTHTMAEEKEALQSVVERKKRQIMQMKNELGNDKKEMASLYNAISGLEQLLATERNAKQALEEKWERREVVFGYEILQIAKTTATLEEQCRAQEALIAALLVENAALKQERHESYKASQQTSVATNAPATEPKNSFT